MYLAPCSRNYHGEADDRVVHVSFQDTFEHLQPNDINGSACVTGKPLEEVRYLEYVCQYFTIQILTYFLLISPRYDHVHKFKGFADIELLCKQGGIMGRQEATGLGVFFCLREFLNDKASLVKLNSKLLLSPAFYAG